MDSKTEPTLEQRIASLEARVLAAETALALILDPIANADSMMHKGSARWLLATFEFDEGLEETGTCTSWEEQRVRAYLDLLARAGREA